MTVGMVKLLIVCGVLLSAFTDASLWQMRNNEPDYKEYAKMARYIVHRLDWTAIGSISTNAAIKGYPMVNVKSYADSARGEKSTGEIYMLITDLDVTGKDLLVDNKLTLLFTQAQYKNCTDPMEPTCARLMITGKLEKVLENTEEHDFGMTAMLSRHPAANAWIMNHEFYLTKVDIDYIQIVDFYGGGHTLTNEEYFAADPDNFSKRRLYRRPGRRNFYPVVNTYNHPTPY